MNKNRLRELLRAILRNTRLSKDTEAGAGGREQHFLGEDSWMRIQWEGEAAVDLRPDPAADLGPSIYITDDGYDAFEDYVAELNKDEVIGGQVSRKAINQAVGALLGTYRDKQDVSDDELNRAIRQHLQGLRALVEERHCFVPVDCLVLSGIPELRVGRVTFRPNTEGFLNESVGKLNAITDTSPMPESEIQQHRQLNQLMVLSHFGNAPTYAELTLSAEEGRLPLLVDAEVDASLNLLRCFTHILFAREFRAQIGLRGDVVRVMRPCLSFVEGASSSLNMQSIGNLQPYNLTPGMLGALKRGFAFEALSDALGKRDADRNSLERVVVTSMRWLGRSIVATAPPEKVLNLAAATERLLLTDNDDKTETGEKQARRMAFLIGKNQSDRQSVFKLAKRYYGLRSDVIHAGKTDISEHDVNEMEVFMVRSLVAVAKRLSEWQSHDDLVRWEQTSTFGSPE